MDAVEQNLIALLIAVFVPLMSLVFVRYINSNKAAKKKREIYLRKARVELKSLKDYVESQAFFSAKQVVEVLAKLTSLLEECPTQEIYDIVDEISDKVISKYRATQWKTAKI